LVLTVTATSAQDHEGFAQIVAQACAKVQELQSLYTNKVSAGVCTPTEQTHAIKMQALRHSTDS